MEIRARSSRYGEAEIAAEIAAALIEARALTPDVSPELDAELAAIHREQAEAIARHDVAGATAAARKHMLYLEQKMFPGS